jgi:hypothetical protein
MLLEEAGLFAVDLPQVGEIYLASGLDVVFIGDSCAELIALTQAIVAVRPCQFAVYWRGQDIQRVLP